MKRNKSVASWPSVYYLSCELCHGQYVYGRHTRYLPCTAKDILSFHKKKLVTWQLYYWCVFREAVVAQCLQLLCSPDLVTSDPDLTLTFIPYLVPTCQAELKVADLLLRSEAMQQDPLFSDLCRGKKSRFYCLVFFSSESICTKILGHMTMVACFSPQGDKCMGNNDTFPQSRSNSNDLCHGILYHSDNVHMCSPCQTGPAHTDVLVWLFEQDSLLNSWPFCSTQCACWKMCVEHKLTTGRPPTCLCELWMAFIAGLFRLKHLRLSEHQLNVLLPWVSTGWPCCRVDASARPWPL